jgi:uncharacterized protein
MKIWVDADACPGVVKDIIVTAAVRRTVVAVFVANKPLLLADSPFLSSMQVNKAPDAADLYIKEHAQKFDLVITQDILLAHILVPAGVVVIDPRGKKYTEDNIAEAVSTRNLMQELRDAGELTGGPKQFGDREKRAFAASFDKELTRLIKSSKHFA